MITTAMMALLMASTAAPPVAPLPTPAIGVDAPTVPIPTSVPPLAVPTDAATASEQVVAPAAPPPAPADAAVPSDPPTATAVKPVSPTTADQDIVVTARPRRIPGDPLQQVNAQAFAVAQQVDQALIGPIALAYGRVVPTPLRSGLRNFLGNLHEPVVGLNFLLQHKIGKAVETVGRFAINSTLGLAGVLDIAKRRPFRLPRRRNGFADTFGFYGIGPGPFLFLPLVGSTTVRDFIGSTLDSFLLPTAIGAPFNRARYTGPAAVLRGLDRRFEFEDEMAGFRRQGSPYIAARTYYLEQRQAEIDALHRHRPKPPTPVVPIPTP